MLIADRISVSVEWIVWRRGDAVDAVVEVAVAKLEDGTLAAKIKTVKDRHTGRRIDKRVLLEAEVEEILDQATEEANEVFESC